ncbi:Tetratricopeptide-like helical domain containing protein [Parasponia andersonii]|uniref:Tetratricopeptide-like helical domain containing protein n=1 Tax=Parasponia andersonii TaxID=3476 RepID=A0A2P5BX04_PARAD|nr:Tetratricopeptide-like helical domain containing protein [Parasponia andersonii]
MTWLASSSSSAMAVASEFASNYHHHHRRRRRRPYSSPSCLRVLCRSGSSSSFSRSVTSSHLKFCLHDALDSSGIQTSHAREAREGFCSQIQKLSDIERETSISINGHVDLGKTALYIAAEDDSLVSHSSVPLPVDAFIDRLDDLSMGYCSHYNSSFNSSPENFLDSLEKYLYNKMGFRRSKGRFQLESRALYLHSVLTHRSGSAAMLSLIYSEILKMLRLWGLFDFDVEIFFPHDLHSLPRGYHKLKSKESDQAHIMTSQALLVEILRNLKDAFWPFQYDHTGSLFLRAARAANCIDKPNIIEDSGFQLASAKAAQHRLERGVWTSVRFGDMRRALAACERLILLETDAKELRDYSILLYHCGFYEQSLEYLKLYQESENCSTQKQSLDPLSSLEEDTVDKLMVRLNLISMEEGWSTPSYARNFLGNNSEPW